MSRDKRVEGRGKEKSGVSAAQKGGNIYRFFLYSFCMSWAGGWGKMAAWFTSGCWIPEPSYTETAELCDFKGTHGLQMAIY